MAVRDVEKGKAVAKKFNFPENSYTVMKLELGESEKKYIVILVFKLMTTLTERSQHTP